MGKVKTVPAVVTVLVLLTVLIFLIFHPPRQQTMSFSPIPNSSLGLAITKNSDGRLFCQLFENAHSISELHPLSSEVPVRHYIQFVDEKTTCVSNIVTVSWLAEDGWDGDLYRVVIDANAQRLIAGSSAWPVGGK